MLISISVLTAVGAAGMTYALETGIQKGITYAINKKKAAKAAATTAEESPASAGDDPSLYFEGVEFPQPTQIPTPAFQPVDQDLQATQIAAEIRGVQNALNQPAPAPADTEDLAADPAGEIATAVAAVKEDLSRKIEELFKSTTEKIEADISAMRAKIEAIRESESADSEDSEDSVQSESDSTATSDTITEPAASEPADVKVGDTVRLLKGRTASGAGISKHDDYTVVSINGAYAVIRNAKGGENKILLEYLTKKKKKKGAV